MNRGGRVVGLDGKRWAGETAVGWKGLRVWQDRAELFARSEDETAARTDAAARENSGPLHESRLSLLLTVDTEEVGRLLYPVESFVRAVSSRRLEVSPVGKFVLEAASGQMVHIRSLRLSVMRDGTYLSPVMLNGQKDISFVALVPGARITILPALAAGGCIDLTDYRIVLEAPKL